MFSLRDTLASRQLPPGYNMNMGIVVLCGRRPMSITRLRHSPCPTSVVVHFKSLVPIDDNITQFIDMQLVAMQRLFAEGDLAVLPGTTEDLSGDPALQPFQNFTVGTCQMGQPTSDHTALFGNRTNVGNDELVIYIVSTIMGGAGNFLGCATHPNGQPGAVVVESAAPWLVAHEVGHVLGLSHVCEDPSCGAGFSDSLMFPNVGWTNVPPDLDESEFSSVLSSGFCRAC